ncbi:MAG TPA: hypothetical protein VGA20_00700 [Gemmatimonadales bacterium]
MDRPPPHSSWQPGVLVPLVLAAALAADVGLRALPRELVSYRVWEALRTFGAETPFRPNAHYDRPRVYGNMAALGNQRDLRDYHRVVFTTDSLGYHNRPRAPDDGGVQALLFGSSFSAGTEVSDGEDLAVRIGALTGGVVYNAAPGDPAPVRARALARTLGLERGLVIYEQFEGVAPPAIAALPPNPREVRCHRALGVWDAPWSCAILSWGAERLDVSPLAVFAARLHRRAQNDRLLPNASAARVIRSRLANGREVLFLADERAIYHDGRRLDGAERYFTWLANRLALQGQRLLVVLAPQKYTVYAPLLAHPDSGPAASPASLVALEARLSGRGIAVVNLTVPLRAAAAAALGRDSLIYWRDDTHWNATGNEVSARAVAAELVRRRDAGAGSVKR